MQKRQSAAVGHWGEGEIGGKWRSPRKATSARPPAADIPEECRGTNDDRVRDGHLRARDRRKKRRDPEQARGFR